MVPPKIQPLDVIEPTVLEAVHLGLKKEQLQIFSDVSTRFEPNNVTAVLGQSGSGKTSLLAVLGGRASGVVSGLILANGAPVNRNRMRLLMSHVSQDDMMFMELTVHQTLYYSALLRSPACLSHEEKLHRADCIAENLGIVRIADSTLKSLSSGQRKRTSAAIEFLSSRPILSFDEPTSGLDSATANALVSRLLVAAKEEGRTVICSFQRPEALILPRRLQLAFDHSQESGGVIVFDAMPETLPHYLKAAKCPCQSGVNPADHMLTVLQRDGAEKWREAWISTSMGHALKASSNRQGVDTEAIGGPDCAWNTKRKPRGFAGTMVDTIFDAVFELSQNPEYPISRSEQFLILFSRTANVWLVDPSQARLMLKMFSTYVIFAISLVYGMPQNFSKLNAMINLFIALYSMTVTPLIVIMPIERRIIQQEYRNGAFATVPYWMARCMLGFLYATFVAAVMTAVYPLFQLSLTPIIPKLFRWFCCMLLYVLSIVLFALTIGMLTSSPLSGMKAVVAFMIPSACGVLWLVSSGMLPPYHLVRSYVLPLHYPNLFSWSFKLLLSIGFTNHGDKAFEVLTGSDYLALNPGNTNSCFYASGIIVAVLFILGFAVTQNVLNSKDNSTGIVGAGKPRDESEVPIKLVTACITPRNSISRDVESGRLQETAGLNPILQREAQTPQHTLRTESNNVENYCEPAFKCRPVNITLKNISYRHETRPDHVALESISISFTTSTLCAIMGPSGAGGSTLLTLLTGSLTDGFVEGPSGTKQRLLQGQVLVNGFPIKSEDFRSLGTLTPQDDFLPEVLTVRQVLLYTAQLRIPQSGSSRNLAVALVEAMLQVFSLLKIADTVVGRPSKVSISRGQKKRVSVAVDLLANRPLMLLDDPTYGLDSASAASLMQTLLSVAKEQNRTIVVSLHQPAWDIMQRVDQLSLLSSGRLVYNDIPARLSAFFASGGMPVRDNDNPLDHAMFVLQSEGTAKWSAHYLAEVLSAKNMPRKNCERPVDATDTYKTDAQFAVSEVTQFFILFRRMSHVFFVDEEQFLELLIPGCITNFVLGVAFYNFPLNLYTGQVVSIGISGLSMFLLSGCVLTIPSERNLAIRELSNGAFSVRAFWFARCAVAVMTVSTFAPIFTCAWYPLVRLSAEFRIICHVFFSSYLCACVFTVMANIIGVVAQTRLRAAQVCDPFVLTAMLFTGTVVTKRFFKVFIKVVYYATPISYATENAVTALFEHKGQEGAETLAYFGFHPENRIRNYCAMNLLLFATIIGGLPVAHSALASKSTVSPTTS